jgi:hypothetical protein
MGREEREKGFGCVSVSAGRYKARALSWIHRAGCVLRTTRPEARDPHYSEVGKLGDISDIMRGGSEKKVNTDLHRFKKINTDNSNIGKVGSATYRSGPALFSS